jgi:hypothetical protein
MTSNKILYVTSFASDMYNASGKILINSFIKHNTEGNLLICYENFNFNILDHPANENQKLLSYPLHTSKYLNTWLRKNKDIIPVFLGGICRNSLILNNEWNRKSSRWFRKIAALEYALTTYRDEYDYIVWLDSDCKILNNISSKFVIDIFIDNAVFYHLGSNRIKNGMGVESSVIGFNKINEGYDFLNNVILFYSSGEFRKLRRWDDGWIFRTIIENRKYKTIDIVTKPYKNFVIEYGAFKGLITHDKGVHRTLNILI